MRILVLKFTFSIDEKLEFCILERSNQETRDDKKEGRVLENDEFCMRIVIEWI